MKSRFFLLAAILFAQAKGYTAGAQDTQSLRHYNSGKSLKRIYKIPNSNFPSLWFVPLSEINAKAARDLEKEYVNLDGLEWYQTENGYQARFIAGGITTEAFYTKKWHLVAHRRQYGEEHLPKDIRHIIKRNYRTFAFYTIVEIQGQGKTTYDIMMEDGTSWLQLRVVDKQIDVLNRFKKK